MDEYARLAKIRPLYAYLEKALMKQAAGVAKARIAEAEIAGLTSGARRGESNLMALPQLAPPALALAPPVAPLPMVLHEAMAPLRPPMHQHQTPVYQQPMQYQQPMMHQSPTQSPQVFASPNTSQFQGARNFNDRYRDLSSGDSQQYPTVQHLQQQPMQQYQQQQPMQSQPMQSQPIHQQHSAQTQSQYSMPSQPMHQNTPTEQPFYQKWFGGAQPPPPPPPQHDRDEYKREMQELFAAASNPAGGNFDRRYQNLAAKHGANPAVLARLQQAKKMRAQQQQGGVVGCKKLGVAAPPGTLCDPKTKRPLPSHKQPRPLQPSGQQGSVIGCKRLGVAAPPGTMCDPKTKKPLPAHQQPRPASGKQQGPGGKQQQQGGSAVGCKRLGVSAPPGTLCDPKTKKPLPPHKQPRPLQPLRIEGSKQASGKPQTGKPGSRQEAYVQNMKALYRDAANPALARKEFAARVQKLEAKYKGNPAALQRIKGAYARRATSRQESSKGPAKKPPPRKQVAPKKLPAKTSRPPPRKFKVKGGPGGMAGSKLPARPPRAQARGMAGSKLPPRPKPQPRPKAPPRVRASPTKRR